MTVAWQAIKLGSLSQRSPAMASKAKFTTMDGYIATFPKEVQGILEKIRQTIRKAAPGRG